LIIEIGDLTGGVKKKGILKGGKLQSEKDTLKERKTSVKSLLER
jgi:hypothetical protein